MQQFSNNATTTLAEPLLDGMTELQVADASAFAELDLGSGDYELVTIAQGDEHEIVRVIGRSGWDDSIWSVVRAQEGTIARPWPAGAAVEARLTAGALSALAGGVSLMAYNAPGGDSVGVGAVSIQPSRTVSTQVASGEQAVAIGSASTAGEDYALALGYHVSCEGWGSAAIGPWSRVTGQHGYAVGAYAEAAEDGVSLGANAFGIGRGGIAIGRWSSVSDEAVNAVALGHSASVDGKGATAVGEASAGVGDDAVALGKFSYATGVASVALGLAAWPEDDFTAHCAALPRHVAHRLFETASGEEQIARTAYFSAPVVTLMSPEFNLNSLSGTALVLPPNTLFFVDTIGLIVVSAASPVGAPTLSLVSLSETPVTVATPGARQIWKSIDSDGLAGEIDILVDAALSSGSQVVRVYLTGLAVQT